MRILRRLEQWSRTVLGKLRKQQIALMVAAAMLFAFFFFQPGSINSFSLRMSSSIKAFSLLVTLQFQDVDAKAEFLDDFKPVAAYIRAQEPSTLGYEILLSDKDELQVVVLERYVDKENAYLRIHKSSKEFLAFRPKLQAMQEAGRVTVSGHSYLDSGLGFVGRS